MQTYKTKKQSRYLRETLRLHFEKELRKNAISRILPVSAATLSRWISTLSAPKQTSTHPKDRMAKTSSSAPSEESVAALKQRVKELEKQLSAAQIEAKAFKTLVEVAESLGMPVRKNARAKR